LPRIRPAVDNDPASEPAPSFSDEPSSQPLPWAVCLLIWAGGAVLGWATIGFLIHLI
jgi:hypothetical protein